MKQPIRVLLVAVLTLLSVPSLARAGESFNNCSDWVNDQSVWELFGGWNDQKASLKIGADGQVTVLNATELECINCEPNNPKRYVVKSVREPAIDEYGRRPETYIHYDPKSGPIPADSRDQISVDYDDQGRVTRVQIDKINGGHGTTINGTHHVYYRDVAEYEFKYDERGCYPAKISRWVYVGENRRKPVVEFDFAKCARFTALWEQVEKNAWDQPAFPLRSNIRRDMADALGSLGLFNQGSQRSMETLIRKSSPDKREKENLHVFLKMGQASCSHTRDHSIDPNLQGPTNLRSYIEARKPGASAPAAGPARSARPPT